MKDNADSDAGPYHSQNKRKHIKKSQGIVTPLNRVFDYAFLRRQPGGAKLVDGFGGKEAVM